MKNFVFPIFFVLVCASTSLKAQIASFPYRESFDSVAAPALPDSWSGQGFSINTSTFRSSPNCISATGNISEKSITSPVFDFTNCIPQRLIFWERRSGTAATYRLDVSVSFDGITFTTLLAHFDTITSTSSYVQRVVYLDGMVLHQQPGVRFRWQVLGDNTNTTGVLRLDDVSLTVSTGKDIGISAITIFPVFATRLDTVNFYVHVKNYGSLTASDFSVHLFSDLNLNNIADQSEQIFSADLLTLNPGDSLLCVITSPPRKGGEYRCIAVLDFPNDENKINDTLGLNFSIRNMKGDVLVNELMYAPADDEPEWVELYNSSPDSINIKNWKISDSNVSLRSIISAKDYFIPPASYLVIAKDENFISMHQGVPSLITYFSALNNTTSDAVVLFDIFSGSIDSVVYQPDWGGQNGKSLERIDGSAPGISATNWGTSLDSHGSTPGRINSIARLDYDLSIQRIFLTCSLVAGNTVELIHVRVQNIGRKIIDSIVVRLYADSNEDMIGEQSEFLFPCVSHSPLASLDSIEFSEVFPPALAGQVDILAVLDCWKDQRICNNVALQKIQLSYESLSLVINEIMYDPLSGQNEWLEFYNRTSQPINLARWTFHGNVSSSGTNLFLVSDSTLMVQPGGFAVIAADSSVCNLFPYLKSLDLSSCLSILGHSAGLSLNNEGDVLVLKDPTEKIIDSVVYSPRFHHPDVIDTHGRSLERINPNIDSNDPRNWSTCVNLQGGTPGKTNSVLTTGTINNAVLSLTPNPFSPDGDGFEDFCTIHYNLPMKTSVLRVRIFDIKGRLVRTLADGELGSTQGDILWDGLDDMRHRTRIGVYIVLLEATDRTSGRNETAKTVAVVATRF
jgi:hypothetical protein